jgi:dephospho-CoA kinase
LLNVGLTGNIASGKSTVSQLFDGWGAEIIDADEVAREVQSPGSPVLAAIAARFGPEVIRPDGSLDRDKLRPIVFENETELASLNAIVHPAIARRRSELQNEARSRGCQILVNAIPLLFEVLDPGDFDLIVLVDAPSDVRAERLTSTRGLSRKAAEDMIAAQLPASGKAKLSDYVIDNSGDQSDLEAAAREVWGELTRRIGSHPHNS